MQQPIVSIKALIDVQKNKNSVSYSDDINTINTNILTNYLTQDSIEESLTIRCLCNSGMHMCDIDDKLSLVNEYCKMNDFCLEYEYLWECECCIDGDCENGGVVEEFPGNLNVTINIAKKY